MTAQNEDRPINCVKDFFNYYLQHFREPDWKSKKGIISPPGHDQAVWIFRGLQDLNEEMKTSLERACKQYFGDLSRAVEIERELLKDFRRRYAIYATLPPPREDRIVEWLSLMQHHGAPTRLLDWTYSYFIAAYFAISDAKDDCWIWALRQDQLNRKVEQKFQKSKKAVHKALRHFITRRTQVHFDATFNQGIDFAYSISPFNLNERLTIQQGVFVCPGNLRKSFQDNLKAVKLDRKNSFPICIRKACHRDILLALHKMNIHSATLFPGFDGFAKSLKTKMLLLSYRPSTMEE